MVLVVGTMGRWCRYWGQWGGGLGTGDNGEVVSVLGTMGRWCRYWGQWGGGVGIGDNGEVV